MNLHQGLCEKRRLGILFGVIGLPNHKVFFQGYICRWKGLPESHGRKVLCALQSCPVVCGWDTFTCLFKCTPRHCPESSVYCLSIGLCKSSKMFIIIRKPCPAIRCGCKNLILFCFCWWPWILFSGCFQVTAFSTDDVI